MTQKSNFSESRIGKYTLGMVILMLILTCINTWYLGTVAQEEAEATSILEMVETSAEVAVDSKHFPKNDCLERCKNECPGADPESCVTRCIENPDDICQFYPSKYNIVTFGPCTDPNGQAPPVCDTTYIRFDPKWGVITNATLQNAAGEKILLNVIQTDQGNTEHAHLRRVLTQRLGNRSAITLKDEQADQLVTLILSRASIIEVRYKLPELLDDVGLQILASPAAL